MQNLILLKDDELVLKEVNGDKGAFTVLVERYRERVFHLLLSIVHNREDAWDLLQDAFLRAYSSLGKLKNPQAFYGWLIRIAVNLAINYTKRSKKSRNLDQPEVFDQIRSKAKKPDDILIERELEQKLSELIERLPIKQRIALVLCDIEGYSYKDIAEITECHIGTVMSRIFHARKRLRDELGPYIKLEEA